LTGIINAISLVGNNANTFLYNFIFVKRFTGSIGIARIGGLVLGASFPRCCLCLGLSRRAFLY
jgi:hypothetical protein